MLFWKENKKRTRKSLWLPVVWDVGKFNGYQKVTFGGSASDTVSLKPAWATWHLDSKTKQHKTNSNGKTFQKHTENGYECDWTAAFLFPNYI